MRIVDLLKKEAVVLNADVSEKEQMLDLLVDLHKKVGNIEDKEAFKAGIMKRESEGPTAIAEGICIPHSKNDAVIKPGIAAITVPGGVDCEALDGEPSNLFFMIAAPAEGSDVHLEALSRLSTILMDPAFREKLLSAKDVEAFLAAIDEKETEKYGDEDKAAQVEEAAAEVPAKKSGYQVLAVTACPTGIAHTYMSAEALEEKVKQMGITIIVETDGSGGTKNAPTAKEIEECEAIIVAADKNVEMARFDGKPVIQVKVADGINKAEELINEALSGNAPIYHTDHASTTVESESDESVGCQIYKHLMNGVSHMLPFVIGGGILIALAFLFDDYTIDPSNFGKNTPLAAFFKTTGDTAFGFMLPILAGYISMSISDRPGLAVGFVGGALASQGNSGFLGALVAGFAAGYLMKGLRKLFDYLPDAFEGLKPVLLYPFFGLLLMALLMTFIINPPVAAINTALTNALNSMGGSSKVILGMLLGGMMTVDMGGPINKAAYVFGTASITSGNYDIMAAVMIGGMVPPLAIALATFFFKNRFTKKEQQTTLTNVIMGLSFITEGAIPFAASDPLHILPACVAGSAVAGALSMFFNCTLIAPHGGIFVIGVISNPLGYLFALAVGSVVGMFGLALLKKPLK